MVYRRIKPEDEQGIRELAALAEEIWREHYDPLLGVEQNCYMIEKFQSEKAIKEQFEHDYIYYMVCTDEGQGIGFMGYYLREEDLYLSKFYLHKDYRGRGISREMMAFIRERTIEAGFSSFELNVNKYNDAVAAYEHLGLTRIRSEVIDIGQGYVMDDYVYRYEI
ncbi:MAG: GNAT family N-acetyltransferase [Lachnospiraceae bacterium]